MRCAHTYTAEYPDNPDPSGRCAVLEVCEDCGHVVRDTQEQDYVL